MSLVEPRSSILFKQRLPCRRYHYSLQLGANSGVHVIIFDDVDGFCTRGIGEDESSGAACDSPVNRLLCEIEAEQLNNTLVIGASLQGRTEN